MRSILKATPNIGPEVIPLSLTIQYNQEHGQYGTQMNLYPATAEVPQEPHGKYHEDWPHDAGHCDPILILQKSPFYNIFL